MSTNAAFTDPIENDVLQYLLTTDSVSPPAGVYLALFTASPGDTGAASNEMTAGDASNGYARQNLASVLQYNDVTLTVSMSSAITISATGNWSAPVTHWAICASGTRGASDVIVYGDLPSSVTVSSGGGIRIDTISVTLDDTGGGFFDNTVNLIFKWLFSAATAITAGTRPTAWYLSLWNTVPDSDADSADEVVGSGYSRVQVTGSNAFSVTGAVATLTGPDIEWPEATGAWWTAENWLVHSAASGTGNGLFWSFLSVQPTIVAGEIFRLDVSTVSITAS